jgi:hypothetical protein
VLSSKNASALIGGSTFREGQNMKVRVKVLRAYRNAPDIVEAGQVVELDKALAMRLIGSNKAALAGDEEPAPAPAIEPEPEPPAKKSKAKE